MKCVYFIASHINPAQVLRFARTLSAGSQTSEVVIHHDNSKSRLDLDVSNLPPRVSVLPCSHVVEWGAFSQVRMCLDSTKWILRNRTFDWLVYLSGQDYPIKPVAEIEEFMRTCEWDALLRAFPIDLPNPWPPGEGIKRYCYRYFDFPRFRYLYKLPATLRRQIQNAMAVFNEAQAAVHIRPRPRGLPPKVGFRRFVSPFHSQFRCYGGPQWFSMNRRCLEYVHDFIDTHPAYVAYYKRTFIPDESIYGTIVANNPCLRLSGDNKRYVHWDTKAAYGGSSPQIIRSEDVQAILDSDAHFARKFDMAVDGHAIEMIDERVHRE